MQISDIEINVLKSSPLLSIDIETKDPGLIKLGPGTHRSDGHICGISIGTTLEGKLVNHYFSFSHPDTSVATRYAHRRIVGDILKTNSTKLGANIIYDLEWLHHEGFEVNGNFHDVQYAEPLLDEYSRSYSLNSLAKKYLNEEKKSNVLKEYCDTMGWKGKPIEHIWRMPEQVAAEYALTDTLLPLHIFKKQKIELESQNLWELYTMEVELIPLLLQMRKNGVRLDKNKLGKTIMEVTDNHYKLKEQLFDWSMDEFNPGSSTQLAKVFDRKGIPYPRNEPTPLMKEKGTPGNPNLDKEALTIIAKQYPICNTILEYRHFDTLINMFLHPYTNMLIDDRLYCSFHPLRSDEYGTVSGRFSSSKPNLQQVSAKDEEDYAESDLLKGKILRSLFIPEEGMSWAKHDYSQIEYRIMAHYASGRGAKRLREKYRNDPTTDFHKEIEDETGFDRRTSKRLNFGGAYGMGVATAARSFGWTIDEATHFMDSYHNSAPYVRKTRALVSKTASRRGYIFTILGRKARTHASRKIYSMFNRLIQGSAADVMKKALVEAYKKGIFDVLVPHITVHDEMDSSFKDNPEGIEAVKELTVTMEEAVEFEVPIIVDCHTGKNWAEAD